MSDGPEVTAEQKLNIANYFIMSAPTGEVDEVIQDVQVLVDEPSVLSEKNLTDILRNYNMDQMMYAPDPETKAMVMVTRVGHVGEDQYVDPNTGRVLTFDQRSRKFTAVADDKQTVAPAIEAYRVAVAASVDKYLTEHYKTGKAVSAVYGSDDGKITICISAKNVNLGNYWTGSWRSVYHLSVSKTGSVDLKGNIKVQVHYFEDGNVQLNTTVERSSKISVKDDATATAAEVAKVVGTLETDWQSHAEEMYLNMHEHTFKAMRRIMPINKQYMNWNLVAHTLAAEMGSK